MTERRTRSGLARVLAAVDEGDGGNRERVCVGGVEEGMVRVGAKAERIERGESWVGYLVAM